MPEPLCSSKLRFGDVRWRSPNRVPNARHWPYSARLARYGSGRSMDDSGL